MADFWKALETKTKLLLFYKENGCCFDLLTSLFLFWMSLDLNGTELKNHKNLFDEYFPTFLSH
jgi:hypothetical protein